MINVRTRLPKEHLEFYKRNLHREAELLRLVCNKAFKLRHNLRVHIMKVHRAIKPFKLNNCHHRSSSKRDNARHIDTVRVLKKQNPFKCLTCKSSFSRKINLQSHVKSVHDKVKGHACTICENAFGRKAHLTSHMEHGGSSPQNAPLQM